MADLASLRIAVDSREVRTARDDLLSLSGSADKANKSVVSLGPGFNALKGIIATLGIGAIAADIARTNAEFQRLQAALTVATGSAGAATAAFNEIRKFAATTPYELNQSVEAFLRLKNLGLDPSMKSLRSYGNTASAMGKDLMQMVEAVADATTGEFERLKEFGIKASKAGNDVAFTFQGVTTTVKNNADAIQQYLLAIGNTQFAGGMEMQMQTLGGQFSNLKDNLDALYVAIGQAGANNALTQLMTSLSAAIVWATENIDLLTQVIGTAVTGFATYYASTMAIGVAISAYTAYTKIATVGTVAFTTALLANPAGAVAVAIAALAAGIFYLKNRTNELTDTTIVQSAEANNLRSATEALNNVLADGSATDAAISSSRALVQQRLQEARAAYEAAKAEVARRNALANVPLIGGIMKLSADKAKKDMLDLQDAWVNGWLTNLGLGKSSVDALVTHAEKATAKTYGTSKKAREKNNSEAERAAKQLAKSIDDLNVAVMDGLHVNMRETLKTMDAIANSDVFQMMDEINKRSNERVKSANAETEARVKTNEELAKTVDYLDQTFGLGGNLGKLFSALKSGFGDVFDALSGAFGSLRDSLSDLLADLGSSFSKVAAGAAIGGIAAKATGGSAAGGAIGGGVGSVLGEKFLTGALKSIGGKKFGEMLGSFAGPLGSIAGGLLGGLIGGLFTKTKQASATLSSIGGQAVVSSIKGNDAQLKGIANNMANGLLKGIANIAEQLGGALGGAVSLSIGQRKKDFVVDPTGQGRTKGAGVINFGEDQAAAIAYATQLAIQQGIITGLSAGANTLIKAGGDLQAQLDKALKFDQVFKDLREQTDPLGYALDNLSKEMEKLKAIFAEAGATAADYAALEELYSIKRQRVIMDAERPRRELEIQLMEATGDAAGALAAKRMLELDAMDASLRALQQQIYAAQDAAAARELEAAAQEAALQEQLAAAEAQRAAEAELARQREEAAQRVKEAEDALRQAYDREASAFRDTIDRFRDLGKTLREFAATLLPLNGNGRASLNELNRKFRETAALARLGNTEAMAALPGIGGELRDAIIDTATDRVSMLRRLSEVRAETESVADVADRQVSIAQQQLDALTTQVEQFVTLNDSVLSVRDAIVQLQAAQAAAASIGAASVNAANAAVSTANAAAKTQGYSAAQQLYMDTLLTMQGQGSPSEIRDYVAELSDYQSLASLANITGQYDAEKYAGMTGYEIAADLSRKFGVAVGTYANGGLHSGGLRVVGENGPELEATGPSRIYNANQLGNMMGGGATAEEVRALRDELKVVMFQIAKNTGKTSDQLQRWDGDGLPDARGF